MHPSKIIPTAAFVFFLVVQSTSAFASSNEAVAEVIRKAFEAGKVETISAALERNIATVEEFYKSRNFKPVWTRDNGPKGKGKALFQELKRASVHGLSPKFYSAEEMVPLMGAQEPEPLAQLDLLLSAAFIDYAHDLRNGRLAKQNLYDKHQVKAVRFAASDLISDAADSGNLRNLASEFLGADVRYVRLISKYVEFGRAKKSGYWPEIDPNGNPIKAGQKDKRLDDIRTLLTLTGDLAPENAVGAAVLDKGMVEATKKFQSRSGIAQTGEIDAGTLAAMAMPVAKRMQQILVNLERRRWQNRELGDNHIYVNLADEQTRIVIGGKKAGFAKLEVGESEKTLPTLFGSLTGLRKSDQGLAFVIEPDGSDGKKPILLPLDKETGSDTLAMFKGLFAEDESANGFVLATPMEAYVTYLTAWANKDGSINFRPDRLNRDGDVAKLLELE